MAWVDQKYIGLMSNQFDMFKRKTETLYNLRCPECGDSRKNKFKARGYFYKRDDGWFFKCHNCSYSVSLRTFLKKHSPNLYREYSLETLQDKQANTDILFEKPEPVVEEIRGQWPLKRLKKISQLQWNHPAKRYIDSRKIPSNVQYKIFYTEDFVEWVNSMIPEKLAVKEKKDKRIIIPLIDESKNLFGFQGRSLDPNAEIRYITIIVNESQPKIYGLDEVDFKKHIYVTEGPFDAMFLPNSIAVCGSDISSQLNKLPRLDKSMVTVVFDNERRNPQIIKSIDNCIKSGYNVCLWPNHIQEKDINDMVVNGMNNADLKLTIDANTHKGLSALMALSVFKGTY